MKTGYFLPLLFISVFHVFSLKQLQAQPVKITSTQNKDFSVDFSYEKEVFGTYFLNVFFTQLTNTNQTSFQGNISGMQGRLFQLKPLNTMSGIGYSFKYSYIRGALNPKVDTTIEYLLPVSKGKNVMVVENTNLYNDFMGTAKPKNWKAFQFFLDPGDTVFAARKGVVVEVNDGFQPDPSKSYAFSSQANSVLIEQKDGTLAHYGVLKNGTIMVKPGDIVYPHTPLALAGTFDTEDHTQLRFYVCYLTDGNLVNSEKETLANKRNYYAFVNPVFYTAEGDVKLISRGKYTAGYTPELLLHELTKRERKKLAK